MIRTLLAALALACALSSPALAAVPVNPFGTALDVFGGILLLVAFPTMAALVFWRPDLPVLCLFQRFGNWFALAIAVGLACCVSGAAWADPACDAQFLDGRRPVLTAPQPEDVELCSSAFVNLWSPVTRDPVYAAEHLTADGLMFAKSVPRVDAFRADPRLPAEKRATLADYRGSRLYDRGHMAPDHDMPNPDAVRESFVLSNMVPQVKANNRGPWAQIEEATRTLVVSVLGGPGGWVVTGPIFDDAPKLLHGRIAVPSRLFKAIYVPADPKLHNELVVGAWVVMNAADPETKFVSLDVLKDIAGIDPFPSLSPELHATAALPAPARKRTNVAGAN